VAVVSETKFAVIGTGSMAASMMSTFAQAGVRVIAVASRDLQRSRRFARAFGIPNASNDLSSLLHGVEVDAVYIANATAEHATTAIAALEAGKAVLCEKPLALSAYEAERVVEVARRMNTLCMEGIWTHFLPAYRRFLELAQTKTCGEPTHLFAAFGYPVTEDALPRLFSPAAGGVLLDRGIYLVALALKVFGPVERTDARLDVTALGVDQNASLQLSHSGGGQSQLAASFTSLTSNTAALACSRGIIRIEEPLIGAEKISTQFTAAERASPQDSALPLGSKQRLVRTLRKSPLLRRFKQALPNARREHLSYGPNQYLPQLEHFLALLKEGARESTVVPLEFSLAVQRVIDQARANHRR
jgi:predicted dehydrogenase